MIPPDENSDFVANMEMVLDIYKKAYDPEFPVVCMDESPKLYWFSVKWNFEIIK